MQSVNTVYSPGYLPVPDSHNVFIQDRATQMAISEASRRLYRTPNGQQQRSGSSMRISKPSSANNSPRGKLAKRSQMSDQGLAQRQQSRRTTRPVSWHPSSHMYPAIQPQPQPQQHLYYNDFSAPAMYTTHDLYPTFSRPSPVMPSYSTSVSPCSNSSPLPASLQPQVSQYLTPNSWDMSYKQIGYFPPSSDDYQLHQQQQHPATQIDHPAIMPGLETPEATTMDWNSYIIHGMGNTTPPTPESLQISGHMTGISTTASIGDGFTCKPLEHDADDDGEILIGMGLYDTPEKYVEDPQLDTYRSAVSSLFGPSSSFRPMGKGLKLEETWEPPKSDDEADDRDAEADEDELSS